MDCQFIFQQNPGGILQKLVSDHLNCFCWQKNSADFCQIQGMYIICCRVLLSNPYRGLGVSVSMFSSPVTHSF